MQVKAFSDLMDVQRLEILKGPQSTLFGKSAIAGAVYITTKPVSGPMQGRASTLFTSDREQRYAFPTRRGLREVRLPFRRERPTIFPAT